MFMAPEASAEIWEVYSQILVIHGHSVYHTHDILSLFTLLIQFDWKSFFFISEDNYELAARLFYVNLSCPMFSEGEKILF